MNEDEDSHVEPEECFDRLLKKPYLMLPLVHNTPGGRERHGVHVLVRQTWGKKHSVAHASFPMLHFSNFPISSSPKAAGQNPPTHPFLGPNEPASSVLTPYLSRRICKMGGERLCGLGWVGTGWSQRLCIGVFRLCTVRRSVKDLTRSLTRSDGQPAQPVLLYRFFDFFFSDLFRQAIRRKQARLRRIHSESDRKSR